MLRSREAKPQAVMVRAFGAENLTMDDSAWDVATAWLLVLVPLIGVMSCELGHLAGRALGIWR